MDEWKVIKKLDGYKERKYEVNIIQFDDEDYGKCELVEILVNSYAGEEQQRIVLGEHDLKDMLEALKEFK